MRRFHVLLAIFGTLSATKFSANASLDEFPGYIHFPNRNFNDIGEPYPISDAALQADCDTRQDCDWFCGGHGSQLGPWHAPYQYDSTVDLYISNTTCGGSVKPMFPSGGCYAPNLIYMMCPGVKQAVDDYLSDYKNKYALPPLQCSQACDQDPECVAMQITRNRSTCLTYSYPKREYNSWLKVPIQYHPL